MILPGSVQSFNSAAQERWHIISKVSELPHASKDQWQQLKNKNGPLAEVEVSVTVSSGVSSHARAISVA